jgi:hypothetical protein
MTLQPNSEIKASGSPAGSSRAPGQPGREPSAMEGETAGRGGTRVSKTMVNFVVDATLLTLAVLLLFTAAVLRFVFPAPSSAAGWLLWGYGYDAWASFQFVLVAVIGLSILLHVMLHWSWVCGVIATRLLRREGRRAKLDDGQQTLWGVGMLIVVVNILGLLVGLAYLTIRGPAL